jgi:hypothetical protein
MSVETLFKSYCARFNARDLDPLVSLFWPYALFEMPLLGQRIFGESEIRGSHKRIFDLSEYALIDISAFKTSGPVIIAEGTLESKLLRDNMPVDMPLAMTMQDVDGKIVRLSVYLDARPYRLWADGPVLAPRDIHIH